MRPFSACPIRPDTQVGYCRSRKQKIRQQVGIPVSIGIGPTKTLAKIATRIAKKNPRYGGAFDITDLRETEELLAACAVEDVWGIDPQSACKLQATKGDTNGTSTQGRG